MNVYQTKHLCCGCTACMNACPQKAIKMHEDEEGFHYPKIELNLCLNCGICKKVCSFQRNEVIPEKEPSVFAARHKNLDILMNSSSGGMFTALSDYILKQNGVIYGAAFDQAFRVRHTKAVTAEQRNNFRGSKYVQSDLTKIFQDINVELKKGTHILFTGTPCQNAGLKLYLQQERTDHSHLYLCDFICHGTPSPLIWKEYIKFLENRFQDKMVSFSFRNKKSSWKNMQSSAQVGSIVCDKIFNDRYSFLNLYSSLYIVRPSCFHCKFTSFYRPSDITIADFWNIAKSKPHFDDDKGISLVLLNSAKGEELFKAVREDLIWEESNSKDCWQPHLEYPSAEPVGRKRFWEEYCTHGGPYVIEKYAKGTLFSRIKKSMTPLLRKTGLYTLAGKAYMIIFVKRTKNANSKHN